MNCSAAIASILRRLHTELPADLYYHSVKHTLEVIAALERLAEEEGVKDSHTLDCLRTAAAFHDSGFLEQYHANEPVAARIAQETLPEFDYTAEDIAFVSRLILATAAAAKPADHYEQLMKDADLDYLGGPDCESFSALLRKEWEARGRKYSTREWYELQLRFLEGHRYYTASAQKTNEKGKQAVLSKIKELLAKLPQ